MALALNFSDQTLPQTLHTVQCCLIHTPSKNNPLYEMSLLEHVHRICGFVSHLQRTVNFTRTSSDVTKEGVVLTGVFLQAMVVFKVLC